MERYQTQSTKSSSYADQQQKQDQPQKHSALADKRLARIVAQGSGEYQTYNPAKDRTGRGRQNSQFLDKYISENGHNSVNKLADGKYQINRTSALQAITQNRPTNEHSLLSAQTAKEFKFKGIKQVDGSLIIDPGKLLGGKGAEKFHNTLVNRLEKALDKGEAGLSQLPDGRYRLESKSNAESTIKQYNPKQQTPVIDQRLARIVGQDTGSTMIYDPMSDVTGQASQNTKYLNQLARSGKLVEKTNDGRYLIDRHLCNKNLADTYSKQKETNNINPKTSELFKRFGQHQEGLTLTIDPSSLASDPKKGKYYQNVINSLEKSLRKGETGLNKTEQGIYQLTGHINTGSEGPTLTPTKDWEVWGDYKQRDSFKALMTQSPMSPSPTMSPSSKKNNQKEQKKLQNKEDDLLKTKKVEEEENLKKMKLQEKIINPLLLQTQLKKYWLAEGILDVKMQYKKDRNQYPLKSKEDLSLESQKEYTKIARRLENIHPQQMAQHLEQRANQVGRNTWWKEHAVSRRMLRSAENQHFSHGETQHGKELAKIRQTIQSMDYKTNRTEPKIPSQSKRESRFNESFYSQLLKNAEQKGDNELRDALVISKETGLRPEELIKGVSFGRSESNPNVVAVYINGAKKSKGLEDSPERYQNDHGKDRILQIESKELAELAERHGDRFKAESSKDALRMRLNRTTASLDPENEYNFSFYTLRHNAKDNLREQGYTNDDIALHMGHTSLRSQQSYGVNNAK